MKFLKRFAAAAAAVVVAFTASVSVFAEDALLTGEEYREYGAAARTAAAPKANYKSGEYDCTIYVKLTCSTSGARIFYTTDGSEPTYYSDIYSEPIRVREADGMVVIRAFAVKTGYEDSETVEFTYTVAEPEEPAVIYMEIYRDPTKTTYNKGDELSLYGGKIAVTYEDGTYKNIDMTRSMVSGFNSNTAGTKLVTVTYEGFSDTFTVKVNEGFDNDRTNAGKENEPAVSRPEADEEDVDDDAHAQISGSSVVGWSSIEKALSEKAAGANVTILLNGAVTVPDTVVRAAAKKDIVLTFSGDEGYKWKLDTSKINKDTIIPYMGLGIRGSAIYIPSVPVNALRGTEAARLHINSDNKLRAGLLVNVGSNNKGSFATLYRYDSTANTMLQLGNVRIGSSGEVQFVPDISGDYVVFVDKSTSVVGDLDNNLLVNALDASVLMRALVYASVPDDVKYDVNGDGFVNALDAAEILRRSVM